MRARCTIWTWMTLWPSIAAAETAGSPPGAKPPPNTAAPDGGNAAPITEINDIKPLLDIGYDGWGLIYLIIGLVLVLILLALAWRFWKNRKKPEAGPAPRPVPEPDAEAYDALDTLSQDNGLDPKLFYFRLSAILRRYMERRYAFPAAEMTTEELLPMVDRLPLASSLATEFKAFCRKADPIKFAAAIVRQEQMAQDLAFSREFVRQTTVPAHDPVEKGNSDRHKDNEP